MPTPQPLRKDIHHQSPLERGQHAAEPGIDWRIVATMATTLHEADKHYLAEVKKRKKRDLFAKRGG